MVTKLNLDIVMLMYNLLEYSDNYALTSGSLWNYYRDEINDDNKTKPTNQQQVNLLSIREYK